MILFKHISLFLPTSRSTTGRIVDLHNLIARDAPRFGSLAGIDNAWHPAGEPDHQEYGPHACKSGA